jgi:hypothetical protein
MKKRNFPDHLQYYSKTALPIHSLEFIPDTRGRHDVEVKPGAHNILKWEITTLLTFPNRKGFRPAATPTFDVKHHQLSALSIPFWIYDLLNSVEALEIPIVLHSQSVVEKSLCRDRILHKYLARATDRIG